eukprot:GHRQ01012324.1.p1 GENE.GHRQ01012324.1~~GHRQ01012324.1.p1  ORF type:complete len:110 (+),score=10.86 GHRQ01012324.1:68-397(+)
MAGLCAPQQQRMALQASTSSRQLALIVRPSLRRSSVAVRAVKLPQGVVEPPRVPTTPEPRFGFVKWAEKINSRAAMLGFFGILIVEAIAHKGIFEMAGFTVGQGLGFEF